MKLCKTCATQRAIRHYHGTRFQYCERCQPIQDATTLAEWVKMKLEFGLRDIPHEVLQAAANILNAGQE